MKDRILNPDAWGGKKRLPVIKMMRDQRKYKSMEGEFGFWHSEPTINNHTHLVLVGLLHALLIHNPTTSCSLRKPERLSQNANPW